jgi:SAM-dependent methyltransferase
LTPEIRNKWNQRHLEAGDAGRVAHVLQEYPYLLPSCGRTLDLACGRGANALRLAAYGLEVSAWDISPVAIDRLKGEALGQGLEISAEVRDVIACPPPADAYDVIMVSYFLERSLAPAIIDALRPGGLLYYETFTRLSVSTCGPSNPAYRLADNELLSLFGALRVRCYREEAALGDTRRGVRDIAMLVAQKPG